MYVLQIRSNALATTKKRWENFSDRFLEQRFWNYIESRLDLKLLFVNLYLFKQPSGVKEHKKSSV